MTFSIIAVLVAVWLIGFSYLSPLSEKEMRVKYRCDRITEEVLKTDVYCGDYNKYLNDFKSGNLIKY